MYGWVGGAGDEMKLAVPRAVWCNMQWRLEGMVGGVFIYSGTAKAGSDVYAAGREWY